MEKTYSLKHLVTVVCFAILVSVLITAFAFQCFVIAPRNELDAYNAKLSEINSLVEKYYVGEVDANVMANYLAAGYTAGLNDKYAQYFSEEEAIESLNSFKGVNSGMGVQVSSHPDTLNILVLEVHKGSPAEKAGLKQNDQIVKIDDKKVSEYGYSNTLQYIKSQPLGTELTLVVLRNQKEVLVKLKLANYDSQSVFYSKQGDYGYIQIATFNNKSPEQFKSALEDLRAKGVKGFIFDLRGNGGGTLDSVNAMVDMLIPEGLMVRVEYKDERFNETYNSDKLEENLPMVVLTDESTASASELFSQSLKDYNKAKTVGRKTYGKGVVQKTFSLSDGSLIKFTIGKYYTKNGTCLDGIGVIPDIAVEYPENELKYRFINGLSKDKDFIAAKQYLDSLS